MSVHEEFKSLSAPGTIGYYNSCEVTQLFLHKKSSKTNIHFFILISYEEMPFINQDYKFLTIKPIEINDDCSLCIQQYRIQITEAETNFESLLINRTWLFNGVSNLKIESGLRLIPKQFISSKEGIAINNVLKNNYNSASYILEFFNETKNEYEFLLKNDFLSKYNKLCQEIKKITNLDFELMRDRIGSIIFQLPIDIAKINSSALKTWDGINLTFIWNNRLLEIPDCYIEVTSTFDGNYMGSSLTEYNKENTQKIANGNLDQISDVKIWRKSPLLLLSIFHGSFLRELHLTANIVNPEPRLFEINGELIEHSVHSPWVTSGKTQGKQYTDFVNSRLYNSERDRLEKTLSFKQYGKGINQSELALSNLRSLIGIYDKHGVYLWDPFLHPDDILATLFFSTTSNATIKAIGAITQTVKTVYGLKGKPANDIISDYRQIFLNPKHNNFGLNLEFRIQHENHGWPFHDRFLMFPGSDDSRPKVYSLGTSINSIGVNHHIIQEVSHPQRVIDAFLELWNALETNDCLVWKSK